jgi:hypothetical protein
VDGAKTPAPARIPAAACAGLALAIRCQRSWFVAPGLRTPMIHSEIQPPAGVSAETLATIRGNVGEALARSAAARALPPETQREIAAHMVRVIALLADPDAARAPAPPPEPEAAPAERLIRQVNFPAFVGELIRGVFQAIVDASGQQMHAYAELIARVSKSVEAFADDDLSQADERQAASTRELAGSRQQQLATMVLMGINRIMEEGAPKSGSPGETTERTSTSEAEVNFKSDYLPLEKM